MNELTRKELTGKELINKIKESDSKDIRELAILCGYCFDSLDVNGNQIIKTKRRKFIQAVVNAGGKVDLFWLVDPYESQRRYQDKNKEKKKEAQQKWLEKNKDKITAVRQSEEYKRKNREQALASYYQRKAKQEAVEKILCEV